MENLFQQIQHLGKPADDDREIKAGHFQRPHDSQRKREHNERRAASGAADGVSVLQGDNLGLEYLIEERLFVESGIFVVHTHSPSPMVGTLAPL